MIDTSIKYIFCPFCGSPKWITDTSSIRHWNQCADCKYFKYYNREVKLIAQGVSYLIKDCVIAAFEPYTVCVDYIKNTTDIYHTRKHSLMVTLPRAIEFNWYKQEELVDKIKTYITFS